MQSILSKDIYVGIVNPENVEKYEQSLNSFLSYNRNINEAIKNKTIVLKEKTDYDNRDLIMAYYEKKEGDEKATLIGIVVFCASCVRAKYRINMETIQVNLPAVRIETFAIQKEYSKNNYKIVFDDSKECSCAEFVMEHFINYIDGQSKNVGITHVHLNSVHKKKVTDFYEKQAFRRFNANERTFEDGDSNEEFCYIRTLPNAIGRTRPEFGGSV